MVCKLHLIQTHYFELEERDQKNLNDLNMTLFRRTEWFVQRHILSLKKYKKSMLLGTTNEFNDLARERFGSQDIIDNCIEAGFMKKGNSEKKLGKFVALTEKGIEFRYFSFFLKYLLEKLEIVLNLYWIIIAGVVSFIAGKWGSQILEFLMKRI